VEDEIVEHKIAVSSDVTTHGNAHDGLLYLYALARLIEANFPDAPDYQYFSDGTTRRQTVAARIRCAADAVKASLGVSDDMVFTYGAIREIMVDVYHMLGLEGWSHERELERIHTDLEGKSTAV
jgi:hypothetical protein